ncbi:MAG: S46 family peptidase [Bacteroidetes bacterium]|nr:S46 family peptidase [Bacteroidota bacterium]
MKVLKIFFSLFIFLLISFKPANPEEGMFLLNQIEKLNLSAAGLKIPVSDVYNPSGISLIDALVRIDGCTGSFVSDEGLIITNHHCAFGAAAALSSKDNNYIDNGFYATNKENEAKTMMTCKITQSYRDVSELVLNGVNDKMNNDEKNKIINANIDAIIADESKKNPKLKIEISQMSIGKFYTLFRYKILNDIRLVYVPPRTVGEFGGESDNWVWPRHNADFSFLRAYENGVPYKPKKFLKINKNGVKENDFVFILGYPGRTFRHQPYSFLAYQKDNVLPFISEWYQFKINSTEEWAKDDPSRKIQIASYVKSLANTAKNYRGKIQGLNRTDVVKLKNEENLKLKQFVNSNAELKSKYNGVLEDIEMLFNKNSEVAKRDMLMGELYNSVGTFYAAYFINSQKTYLDNLSDKNEKIEILNKNKEILKKNLQTYYKIYGPELDELYLKTLLKKMTKLPENIKPQILEKVLGNNYNDEKIDKFVEKLYRKSKLKNTKSSWEMFEKDIYKFFKQKEPMMDFAKTVENEFRRYSNEKVERDGKIAVLMPKFTEIKMKFYENTFIPDANSTLRFTYGHVKGFTPRDGEYNKPFTYIKGIIEKSVLGGDYNVQTNILSIYQNIQPADVLVDKTHNDVPVAILYDLDTTGGNSGSPVLDAEGNLIAVNFDRAFTATINDYAWNESYSRSIGVDARFVLYVMKYIGNTERLLNEVSCNF